jgi:hypothetical protein
MTIRNHSLGAAIALMLSGAAPGAEATRFTIARDVSESNPLVTSPVYAKHLAIDVVGLLTDSLKLGDEVYVRKFAQLDLANLAASHHVQVNRQNRPQKVARDVARLIASTPKHEGTGQGTTNITEFLERTDFDCPNGGMIVLLTDGMEASEETNPQALLDGKTALPKPSSAFLKGCRVLMLGLGNTSDGVLPGKQYRTLIGAWSTWMHSAGAAFEMPKD